MSWAALLHLDWRAPAWGWLALAPLVFWGLSRFRREAWERYADPGLRPWAVRQLTLGSALNRRSVLDALMWILLAVALAGPRLPLDGGTEARTARHDLDLVIALDVSTSMNAADIAPSRLERARLKVQDLLPRLQGERVALIAFAGEAGLALPPTRDRDAVLQTLPLLDGKLFEEQGTHLAAAFELALKSTSAKRSRALLLLTDAEPGALSGAAGKAATTAAQALAKSGMPLSILALASEASSGDADIGVPDFAGYEALAQLGGGQFARVADGTGDLAALYDRGVLLLPGARFSADPAQRWRELYAWPLALALLLLLVAHARWRKQVLLAATLAASAGAAQADDAGWREAHAAYLNRQYLVAQQSYARLDGYHARMGEGAAAYRRKDYAFAAKQFTQAWLQARDTNQRADALFNLGNAYYFSGNRQAARDAFYDVLRLRPNDSAARHNLARATVTLAAKDAAASVYIPGRMGKGLAEGPSENDRIQELEPGKEEEQPLLGENVSDAERARGRASAEGGGAAAAADPRAALKKVDLLNDARREVLKQSMKQDAKRERPEGLSAW